jgi:hypothetical protein
VPRPLPHRPRRLISLSAIGVSAVAACWALYLVESGGFDTTILGLRISSHNPRRALACAVVALAVFLFEVGVTRMRSAATAALRRIDAIDDRFVAGALAAATVVMGLVFCSTSVGGADSYGYVSEADLLHHGRLSVSQQWVAQIPWPSAAASFTPLGYGLSPDPSVLVPMYAPGLPLLMTAAQMIGGHCAVFGVVPLFGGVLVLATYGLARRLGSSRAGVIAAWLVATSPVFLYMLMAPMSDVPVAAAWTLAFWCLAGGTFRSAAGAGLAVSAAVLIRLNLAPLAGVIEAWLLWKIWRDRERRRRVFQAVGFLAGLLPGVILAAAINWSLYGSPLRSGYGNTTGWFAWANVVPNIQRYGAWFAETQTPLAFAGVAALLVPVKALWPEVPDRTLVVAFGLFVLGVWTEYCLFGVFDAWWFLRFLLPGWPFIMIGVATVALALSRSGRAVAVAVAVTVAVIGIRGVRLAVERSAFEMRLADSRYPSAARIVRDVTEPTSVIFSMQHSGSLRYYAGRLTLQYPNLDHDWLDRSVAWLEAQGVHAYALLEDWELPDFTSRFAGQRTLSRLDVPLRTYRGPWTIYLYDLTRSVGSGAGRPVVETFRDLRCMPPAAPPRLFQE